MLCPPLERKERKEKRARVPRHACLQRGLRRCVPSQGKTPHSGTSSFPALAAPLPPSLHDVERSWASLAAGQDSSRRRRDSSSRRQHRAHQPGARTLRVEVTSEIPPLSERLALACSLHSFASQRARRAGGGRGRGRILSCSVLLGCRRGLAGTKGSAALLCSAAHRGCSRGAARRGRELRFITQRTNFWRATNRESSHTMFAAA